MLAFSTCVIPEVCIELILSMLTAVNTHRPITLIYLFLFGLFGPFSFSLRAKDSQLHAESGKEDTRVKNLQIADPPH